MDATATTSSSGTASLSPSPTCSASVWASICFTAGTSRQRCHADGLSKLMMPASCWPPRCRCCRCWSIRSPRRGAHVSYDLRVRGGVRVTLAIRDGELTMGGEGQSVDCHVSADLVSLLFDRLWASNAMDADPHREAGRLGTQAVARPTTRPLPRGPLTEGTRPCCPRDPGPPRTSPRRARPGGCGGPVRKRSCRHCGAQGPRSWARRTVPRRPGASDATAATRNAVAPAGRRSIGQGQPRGDVRIPSDRHPRSDPCAEADHQAGTSGAS